MPPHESVSVLAEAGLGGKVSAATTVLRRGEGHPGGQGGKGRLARLWGPESPARQAVNFAPDAERRFVSFRRH